MIAFKGQQLALICILFITGSTSILLIPEELPSVLSIFYSNVPPIKKGTDSRIGLGFRLGPNADFQVQFELGPQLNTQAIGPDAPAAENASKKRQAATHSSHKKYNITNPSEKWLNTWNLKLDNSANQVLPDQPLSVVDPTRENSAFVNHLRKLYENPQKNHEE